MAFFGDIAHGAFSLMKGFPLAFSKGYKRFLLIPILLNTLLFFALTYFIFKHFSTFIWEWLAFLPSWGFLLLAWLIALMYWFGIVFFFAFTFVFFTTTLASPFYGLMSEKFLKKHRQWDAANKNWFSFITSSIWRECQKWLGFIPLFFLCCFFLIIPVVNLFTPFIWFLFLSYIATVQFVDYAPDTLQIPYSEVKRTLRKRPGLILGFGGLFFFLLPIVVLNLILPNAAVLGGTFLWKQLETNQ